MKNHQAEQVASLSCLHVSASPFPGPLIVNSRHLCCLFITLQSIFQMATSITVLTRTSGILQKLLGVPVSCLCCCASQTIPSLSVLGRHSRIILFTMSRPQPISALLSLLSLPGLSPGYPLSSFLGGSFNLSREFHLP